MAAAHPVLQRWLALPTSLTARLQQLDASFRVQLLMQKTACCHADEALAMAIAAKARVHVREVLLHCGGRPVIFARTVVPALTSASDWPKFRKLGERSLGIWLFSDPRVRRGALSFARLPSAHPLAHRIRTVLPQEPIESRLHARRCLFRRKRGLMLVTEVFLPRILMLN